jgi:hypothetical protein
MARLFGACRSPPASPSARLSSRCCAGPRPRRSVVWDTNELLEIFSDLRILQYEDTIDVTDFGRGETPVVRLLARKDREQAGQYPGVVAD